MTENTLKINYSRITRHYNEYIYSPFWLNEEFWLKCKAFAFPYTGVVPRYIEYVRSGKNNAEIAKYEPLKTHSKVLFMQNEPNLNN